MRIHGWTVLLTAALLTIGCASQGGGSGGSSSGSGAGIDAVYTGTPIVVDGWLDEAVWKKASVYPLVLGNDVAGRGKHIREPGTVRLAWDDQNLYVAIEFTDDDIVAEGQTDQLKHFALGDLCEVFLKPEGQTWYWELYATPMGRKSSFWFPGRGRFGLPSNFQYNCGLRVAAKAEGTVNNWQDKDKRWTAEMAMPIRDLTARGESFGPGSAWRVLVARYNYSRYRVERGPELTMTPRLSETSFHLLEEYAKLRFKR